MQIAVVFAVCSLPPASAAAFLSRTAYVASGMKQLSVLILTCGEENYTEKYLRLVLPLNDRNFVVDSGSTDRTVELAEWIGTTSVVLGGAAIGKKAIVAYSLEAQ